MEHQHAIGPSPTTHHIPVVVVVGCIEVVAVDILVLGDILVGDSLVADSLGVLVGIAVVVRVVVEVIAVAVAGVGQDWENDFRYN